MEMVDGVQAFYEFEIDIGKELLERLLALDSFSEKCNCKYLEKKVLEDDHIHHTVMVEKFATDKSKFVVKIFKNEKTPNQHENFTQTKLLETRNERVQTSRAVLSSSECQTEIEGQDCGTQTPAAALNCTEVQTEESRLHSKLVDKQCESDFNLSSQRHVHVMAAPENQDSYCQAVAKSKESFCQSEIYTSSVLIQTETHTSSASVQTMIMEKQETSSQTSCSISCETEAGVQAVVEIVEHSNQTDSDMTENNSQTDMSFFLQQDSYAQATVHLDVFSSQTEVPVEEVGLQTECNMSTQCDGIIQASVDVDTQSLQTETKEESESCCVTDCNLSTQECKDVQTETSSLNDLNCMNDTITTAENVSNSILDQSQDMTDLAEASLNNSHFTSISYTTSQRYIDGISQTDPVTIIIGDASFLVQKLKNSAVGSSKVTTLGNEIEIELSADAIEQDLETKVKEDVITNIIKPVQDMPNLMSQRSGGVRMRMPVSSHQSSSGSLRNPQPAPIQHRAPNTFVSSHQRQQSQTKIPPGLFSCPFCNLCFIESPALYEHLSEAHQSDLKSKWKKTRGREGKTIIPKNPQLAVQNNKGEFDVSKTSNRLNSSLEEPDTNDIGSRIRIKRKKEFAGIPSKYSRLDDDIDDDVDNDDDDDDDYIDEEEVHEKSKTKRGRKKL